MRKRLTSFLLCFFLCISLIPVSAQAIETTDANTSKIPTEGDVWDGSITQPTKLVQKDGVYYYEITKCAELAYMAQTGGDWLGYNYILGNNLILNDVELTWNEEGELTNTEPLLEWTPISDFSGLFDGNNYYISGAFVDEANSSRDYKTGFFDSASGSTSRWITIKNLSFVNSYVRGEETTGGLAGGLSRVALDNCSFSGCVSGNICGGLVGSAGSLEMQNCNTSGIVTGNQTAGGLLGGANGADIINCHTNCVVIGRDGSTGGLLGDATNGTVNILDSSATGVVSGNGVTGGFIGYGFNVFINRCVSAGDVTSANGIAGGFIGEYVDFRSVISNCYSVGNVNAATFSGGFVGSCADDIINCYSVGSVTSENNSGGFIGEDRRVWGEDFSAENCFYIKDINYNSTLFGTSIASLDTVGEIEGKTCSQLKVQSTFSDWDFADVWSISADKNGGYPYLQWQESTLSNIAVNDVEISEATLALTVGDYAYLTATVSPFNASNQSVAWKSSDSDIATVSAAGKVTAISAGTAAITATTEDGSYTASCTVTVTERLSDEYRINSITVRDNDGAVLSEIPAGTCLATVSITNLASEGNTLVFLSAYTSAGQYQGMMWVSVEDLPVGATIKVTLPVDNSNGKIANIKAFTVASFSNLTPLGEAVSFLP